eukprot:6187175-Pleurochrysis_carterae.AAC.3
MLESQAPTDLRGARANDPRFVRLVSEVADGCPMRGLLGHVAIHRVGGAAAAAAVAAVDAKGARAPAVLAPNTLRKLLRARDPDGGAGGARGLAEGRAGALAVVDHLGVDSAEAVKDAPDLRRLAVDIRRPARTTQCSSCSAEGRAVLTAARAVATAAAQRVALAVLAAMAGSEGAPRARRWLSRRSRCSRRGMTSR